MTVSPARRGRTRDERRAAAAVTANATQQSARVRPHGDHRVRASRLVLRERRRRRPDARPSRSSAAESAGAEITLRPLGRVDPPAPSPLENLLGAPPADRRPKPGARSGGAAAASTQRREHSAATPRDLQLERQLAGAGVLGRQFAIGDRGGGERASRVQSMHRLAAISTRCCGRASRRRFRLKCCRRSGCSCRRARFWTARSRRRSTRRCRV